MARRGGKASSRRARRRQQLRPGSRPSTPAPAQLDRAPDDSRAPALGDLPDAFERADAEVRASATPPMASTSLRGRSRPAEPRLVVGGSSRLTDRAAAEYHYVLRDLRNIGVLVVVLAVLLAVATIGVNALGIGRA